MKTLQLLILSFLILSTSAWGCPSCNGDEIEITGIVIKEVFPGPPNYENIVDGDKPETYWFIVLDKNICFSPDDEFISEEVSLNKLQLLLDRSEHPIIEGNKYIINGITVPANTGHHHSDVLLKVKSIRGL